MGYIALFLLLLALAFLYCAVVFLFWAFVAAAVVVMAVVMVAATAALFFASIARNCKASDAVALLFSAGPLTAWEYIRSNAPLQPPEPADVALLAEPKPAVTEHCSRERRRRRSAMLLSRSVYTPDSEDLRRRATMKAQMEHLNRWRVARVKQVCRDGQMLRLTAKTKPPWGDEL